MPKLLIIVFTLFLLLRAAAFAQKSDSSLGSLQQLPTKYISSIDKKITTYSNRITSKTVKTLTKLSNWENKLHVFLLKADPAAAESLFGNNQPTFTSLLQQIKQGETIAKEAQAPYDKYRDDITISLNYIAQQKQQLDSSTLKKAIVTSTKMKQLNTAEDNGEAIQQFIKTRKKQLMVQALQQAGSSKYLAKINKESFYYTETLKNYKELFSDSRKAEETGKEILNNIPAFRQFAKQNSQLASLFNLPGNYQAAQDLTGLQTRSQLAGLLQQSIAAGGADAQTQIQQNLAQAHAEMDKLNSRINQKGGGSGDTEIPAFNPNNQKTKLFFQCLQYGFNIQFVNNTAYAPNLADVALSLGYKINDKSILGVGIDYKVGMGTIQHIKFSHQGIGARTFMDWKIKKQFYASGGYEINHNAAFENFAFLKNYNSWQRSALLGLAKKYKINKKVNGEIKLLYNFLANRYLPVSQPFIFRVGYTF